MEPPAQIWIVVETAQVNCTKQGIFACFHGTAQQNLTKTIIHHHGNGPTEISKLLIEIVHFSAATFTLNL